VPTNRINNVLDDIRDERVRQDEMLREGLIPHDCTNPSVNGFLKLAVLTEEVGEVARALNDDESYINLYTELIQVAAVAVAIAESIYVAIH